MTRGPRGGGPLPHPVTHPLSDSGPAPS